MSNREGTEMDEQVTRTDPKLLAWLEDWKAVADATCVVGGCTDPNCNGVNHTGEAGQRWTESEATYRLALAKRERNPWY